MTLKTLPANYWPLSLPHNERLSTTEGSNHEGLIRGTHGSYKEGLSCRKDKTLVVSNVATVRLPIGHVFTDACHAAAIKVFRMTVVLETRNLKGGISFIVVTAKVSHQTLPVILPFKSPLKQVEHFQKSTDTLSNSLA